MRIPCPTYCGAHSRRCLRRDIGDNCEGAMGGDVDDNDDDGDGATGDEVDDDCDGATFTMCQLYNISGPRRVGHPNQE